MAEGKVATLTQSLAELERDEKQKSGLQARIESDLVELSASCAKKQEELESISHALEQLQAEQTQRTGQVQLASDEVQRLELRSTDLQSRVESLQVQRSKHECALEEQQRRGEEQDSQLRRLEAAVEATERQKQLGLSELAEIENRRLLEKARSTEIARALEFGTAQEKALQSSLALIVDQQRALQEQLATAQVAKEQLSKELAAEALLLSRLKDDSRELEAARILTTFSLQSNATPSDRPTAAPPAPTSVSEGIAQLDVQLVIPSEEMTGAEPKMETVVAPAQLPPQVQPQAEVRKRPLPSTIETRPIEGDVPQPAAEHDAWETVLEQLSESRDELTQTWNQRRAASSTRKPSASDRNS